MTPVGAGGFKAANTPDYVQMILEGTSKARERRNNLMHATPEDAIEFGYITQEQLEEYEVFICCREPLDRYMSAFRHINRRIPDPGIFKVEIEKEINYGLLTKPTTDYAYSNGVMIAELLDHGEFVEETRRMLAAFGSHVFPIIPQLNMRRTVLLNGVNPLTDYWTPELQDRVKQRFAGDVTLHENMKAGTL